MPEGGLAGARSGAHTPDAAQIEAVYPLSPMQEGMLFHSLHDPGEHLYLEQFTCDICGPLNIPAFSRAWEEAVRRHPILRTGFVTKRDGTPLQVVRRVVRLPLTVEDWSAVPPEEQETRIGALLAADGCQPFDTAEPPLMRLRLISRGGDVTRFIWTHHHVLLDGWSLPLLIQEVLEDHDTLVRGGVIMRKPVRPFADFITWLGQQDPSKAERYWRRILEGFDTPTPVIGAHPRAVVPAGSDGHAKGSLRCADGLLERVGALARQQGVTIASVINAAWAMLLRKYSGQEDVVFGVTVSGRPPELAGVERMIGLFINTLPLRVRFRNGDRVPDLLQRVHEAETGLREFENTPLVRVQGWSAVPPGTPMFPSIVVVENYPVDPQLEQRLKGIELRDARTIERTNYPLTLAAVCRGELTFELAYTTGLHDAAGVQRILAHLQHLLDGICRQPGSRVQGVPMLTGDDERVLTAVWPVSGGVPDGDGRMVMERFDDVVRRTPHATAVMHGAARISYAELADRANALAARLVREGVGPECVVVVDCERSPALVAAFVAVLRAGGVYCPLDRAQPLFRRQRILALAQPVVLLTDREDDAPEDRPGYSILRPDGEMMGAEGADRCRPFPKPDPLQAAYMIFTSGSTGEPKGVVVPHGALAGFVRALGPVWPGHGAARFLQFASPAFDASVGEMVLALCSGTALVQVPRDVMYAPADLAALIDAAGVTAVTLPPSVLDALPEGPYPTLRTICAVADTCPWSLAHRWSAVGMFFNGYGPTETAIAASFHRFDGMRPDAVTVPIGRPLPGARLYVLDRDAMPVPVGVPGELCIGGYGVARGYTGRPELTADRFVPDPYSPHAGDRMYRTGDLVRLLADGIIEFIGRIDRQVKIRGLRIEPEEIEVALAGHPAVREAVVTVSRQTDDGSVIHAFVTVRDGVRCDPDDVLAYLRSRMPAYMVPASVATLERMPRTVSGKIDRHAVAREQSAAERSDGEPTGFTEDVVAGIWASVLECPRPHRRDDFFALGGHSLLATRVAARVREAFGVEVPVDTLFEHRRLDDLAAWIDAARRDGRTARRAQVLPVPRTGAMPASFPQRRIWFLERLEPGSAFFVIPCVAHMRGPLDVGILDDCLQQCVRRHESLRTTFAEKDGQPVAMIANEGHCPVRILDLTAMPSGERQEAADRAVREATTRPFDLSAGPLFRALIVRVEWDEHILALALHHAVADGWSAGILLGEVRTLYAARVTGETAALPVLPVQYADFSVWQQETLTGPRREELVRYWSARLAGIPAGLDLLPDHPRPRVASARGAIVTAELPPAVSDAVRLFSNAETVTPYMTLLAVFQVLLHRLAGQETVVVGSPVAGRPERTLEGIIGCFVNTLVLRADITSGMTFRRLLRQVRGTCLDAYAHQDLPFELLVEELQPVRDLSRTPLFQAAFVFQNLDTGGRDLPGIAVTPVAFDNGTAKYELTMTVVPGSDRFTATLEYNTDLFTEATARGILRRYCTLVRSCIGNPGEPLERCSLLDAEERRTITSVWNATARPFPDGTTAHAWFERVAAAMPDAPALIWRGGVVLYAGLNQRANRFAHVLRRRGVGVESVAGICLDRSPDLIAGILGIMKAGAAFLPLDPAYPPERLHAMCGDAAVRAVVTTGALRPLVGDVGCPVFETDGEAGVFTHASVANPEPAGGPDTLAYVIFTSGSTGRPKGSMLQHRGLCNLAAAQHAMFPLGPGSRVLQFASPSFDAAVWELVMTLLSGGALVLEDRASLMTGQGLRDVLLREQVSMITIPPSALAVVPEEPFPALRAIVVAGERCPADLVERWSAGRQMVNAYGPTETTVCASAHVCAGSYRTGPPIGRPLPNVRLYILDRHGEPVPPGVPGELFIGGEGVARGYCGRPDLTAGRFVPDPFGPPGARLYRSGDRCRFRHDGEIEFLGRCDTQVKVRGYRIEPGEIQAVLVSHPQIAAAEVIVREDTPGDQRITAYAVAQEGMRPGAEELRTVLRRTLPAYMIPSAFVFLDALPLTPAGKVDVRALPRPEEPSRGAVGDASRPADPIEAEVSAMAAELLGLRAVGAAENFFELGGHSLLATRFIARIRDRFGVELPVRALFEDPTVAGIAAALRAAGPDAGSDREKLHDALRMIEGLSEEEAQQFLKAQAHG